MQKTTAVKTALAMVISVGGIQVGHAAPYMCELWATSLEGTANTVVDAESVADARRRAEPEARRLEQRYGLPRGDVFVHDCWEL